MNPRALLIISGCGELKIDLTTASSPVKAASPGSDCAENSYVA